MLVYKNIGELIQNRLLNVSDAIEYYPKRSKYFPNPDLTGFEYSEPIKTNRNIKWIILAINSEEQEVYITTMDAVNINQVIFMGIRGFFGCTKELHNICKALYSNSELNIFARSIVLGDIVRLLPYDWPSVYNYAYFKDEPKKGYTQYNGQLYRNVYYKNENARFYVSDGGGIVKTDYKGIEYRVPSRGSPVFVTERLMHFSTKYSCDNNYLIPSTYLSSMAYNELSYNVRIVKDRGYILPISLEYLNGNVGTAVGGIRPVVTLKASTTMSAVISQDTTKKIVWKVN